MSITKEARAQLMRFAHESRDSDTPEGGCVILGADGEATGWICGTDRVEPSAYVDGTYAVHSDGRIWVARGGDYWSGAERWEEILRSLDSLVSDAVKA